MKNIRKSQKKRDNELLPQRRSKLGKYILIAVVVHAVLAVLYFQFNIKKPGEEPGIKVKPEKIISKPAAKEMLTTAGTADVEHPLHLDTERRPMSSSMSLAKPLQASSALPPMVGEADPKAPGLDITAVQLRTSWPEEIDQPPKKLPVKRVEQADMQLRPVLKKEPAYSIMSHAVYPADAPAPYLKSSVLDQVVNIKSLSRKPVGRAAGAGKMRRLEYLSSHIVFQEEAEYPQHTRKLTVSFSQTGIIPRIPPAPDPLSENVARLINRVIQPSLEKYTGQKAPILVKNMTYRDKGLESEVSKYLSGLIRSEIKNLDRVALLAPTALSKSPHLELEGEIWDELQTVSIYLRIKEGQSNRKLNKAALKIARQLLPLELAIKPPKGKSLDIVQSVVALMNKLFPQPGDFQISVWPNKGLDTAYIEGEKFSASILAEKDAYLLVDYYQVDGKVIHFLPNPLQSNFVEGGRPFVIGDPDSPYEFIVGKPYGEELLVVVASQEPILLAAPNLIEPAKSYLMQLSVILREQKAAGKMAGAHYIILTKEREP